MLLALDIGNTQISYGVFAEKGGLLHHWRSETKHSRTEDEYAAFLFPLFQLERIDLSQIEGIAVCSVVPAVNEAIALFCTKYLKITPFFVGYTNSLEFLLNVDLPQEVGADRIANAAYAVKHLSLPAIVVDMGTATTFDVVTRDRIYEGGIILPGVRMGAEALTQRTALLPQIDVQFPQRVIGKNTVSCIQSGVLFGYLDAVDGLLKRLAQELEGATIVLTGGIAPMFHEKLSTQSELLPHLTLEGIQILFQLNRRSQI